MKLTEKAIIGFIDNDKGIAVAENNRVKEIWFTKLRAKDFKKR